MRIQSLALLAGITVVTAESTVTLFIPGFEAQSIEGQVIGSSGSMTSYRLNCPSGADITKCGLPNGVDYTIAEGPSSVNYGFSYENSTITQSCVLQGTTQATCEGSMSGSDGGTTISTAFKVSDIPYGGFQAVRVTATSLPGSASTGASPSATTATSTDGAVVTTTSAPASTNGAEKTESTNAAIPMVTGNARWAAGGVAAMMALAAI
ncbi:uncharacterized protein N7459_001398 [Penicillium hispanicum]|uniref:uncharacterized protein n=1 Tax=Penicillium hispanicum TaxID=1080232 RepID=UPI0025405F09|nr:uncharacterized protein N7459_001398 [Penicillium hispanicum]KAJ5595190.1 hypothetical protein N7459_001398 [Penicillium hispanicum]